ncbi:MAG: hypothetical protein RL090_893 [Bacteroidota bacterium]
MVKINIFFMFNRFYANLTIWARKNDAELCSDGGVWHVVDSPDQGRSLVNKTCI